MDFLLLSTLNFTSHDGQGVNLVEGKCSHQFSFIPLYLFIYLFIFIFYFVEVDNLHPVTMRAWLVVGWAGDL